MRTRIFGLTLAVVLSASHGAFAQAAPLGETLAGSAKDDYVAGKTLFNDGDAAGALVKFQSAYDASKDARLFWNIGASHKALRKYSDAIRDLERFKEEAAAQIGDQDKKEADEIISALRPFVAAVTVKTTPSDASVLVDGQPAGNTPLQRRLVDLGKHQITAKKDGFTESTTAIDVTGNADVVLDLQLAAVVQKGRLVVNASAGDAISLDGKAMAMGNWEGDVAIGEHLVRVTAPKKNPYETHVAIGDRETRTLQVTLDPIPEPKTPTWIWISLGAGGAVAITVITALLVGGGSEQANEPVRGTMQPGYITMPSFPIFGR